MFIFLQAHLTESKTAPMFTGFNLYKLSAMIFVSSLKICLYSQTSSVTTDDSDKNDTITKLEVIRVVKPGIFDLQTNDYVVRMRIWGTSFPQRGQPGYEDAISFCETKLLSTSPLIEVVRTFDENNLKVVKLRLQEGGKDFTTESIANGLGWHNEKETGRFGPLILAQLKAKRGNLGIWQSGFNYNADPIKLQTPQPSLSGAFMRKNQLLPQISFWVTSFGKIHRPGCSFYERGRGTLMAKPSGTDCRICGGRRGKR
jgi:hypothetical protein